MKITTLLLLATTLTTLAQTTGADTLFTTLPPWPESPKIPLVRNKENLLTRSPQDYIDRLADLKDFEKKIRSQIKKTGQDPTHVTLATPPSLDKLKSWENLIYTRHGERALIMDIYRPTTQNTNLPAIILVHGGGWFHGTHRDYRPLAMNLAKKGFITATVEYRLAGESPFPAAVYDLKAAIRYLRANAQKFNLKTGAIAIAGGSAGGHLSLLTAYTNAKKEFEGKGGNLHESSNIQAVVSFYGGTDFCAPIVTRRGMNCAAAKWIATPFDQDPARYISASPVHHIEPSRRKITPPTLFVSPTPAEPWNNLISTKNWLVRCGNHAEQATINAPHGFLLFSPYQDQAISLITNFLHSQKQFKN